MTTDIIFGHGRALQFERYITCKSIDITALFTNTPRHHTALVYHKMWRAEARVPEADRVMERGEEERLGVPSDTLPSNRLGKQVPGKYFARLNVFTEPFYFYFYTAYRQPCIRHIENRLAILLFTYSIQITCQRH